MNGILVGILIGLMTCFAIKLFSGKKTTVTFEPEKKSDSSDSDEVNSFLNNLSNEWNDSDIHKPFEKIAEVEKRNDSMYEDGPDETAISVIHLYIPKEVYPVLKALKERANVSSEQELVNKALSFLAVGFSIIDSGRVVVALDIKKSVYKEIDLD